jgi:MFS family permease
MEPEDARVEPGFRALMRLAPFRLLLGVRVLWSIGIQMLLMAMGWHAYEISGDTWVLALIGLYQFLPVLLFSIPAGYVVDRFARQKVVSVCMVLQALAAMALMVMTLMGAVHTHALYAVCLVLGISRAALMPALQAIVPALVATSVLPRAMASVSTATQLSVILGPALAGLLIAWDVAVVYGLAMALFVIALFLPLGMRLRESAVQARKMNWQTLFAGFAFIGGRPIVLGAILLDLFAVLFGGAIALLPVYVKDVLQGSSADLGFLRAAPAVGAIAMSVWLMARPMEQRVGAKLLWAVGLFGASAVAFGLSRSVWLSGAVLLLYGAADMVSVVIRQTLVQLETPDEMRGRVSAVNSVFIGASNQLGEFQVAAAATLLGPVPAVVLGGVLTMILPVLWRQIFPALARRDRMAM